MAAWQYSLTLLPTEWLKDGGVPEALLSDDGWDVSDAWRNSCRPDLANGLSELLPGAQSWDDSLQYWGDETSDDIQLWSEDGQIIEILFRFDLRSPNSDLFQSALRFAASSDLVAFELERMKPLTNDLGSLLEAVVGSRAAEYCGIQSFVK